MFHIVFPKRGIGLRILIRQALRSFFEKGGPTTSAAIAYFTLITLFPTFLLFVALGDKFIKIHGMSREVAEQVIAIFPGGTRHFILTNLDTLISAPSWGSIVTYASIFIWVGMWVFHLVEESLDKAWNVEIRHSFWRRKVTNFAMIFIGTICLLGSALLMASIHFLGVRIFSAELTLGRLLFQSVLGLCAFILMAFFFTLVYKIIPNARVLFREALSGGLIASLLWHVANAVFVWTIPYFHYEHVYGSIWALITICIWIYVSCWIMLLGAHLTYHIHRFAGTVNGENGGRASANPHPDRG